MNQLPANKGTDRKSIRQSKKMSISLKKAKKKKVMGAVEAQNIQEKAVINIQDVQNQMQKIGI